MMKSTLVLALVAVFAVSAAALGVANNEKSERLLSQMTKAKAHNFLNMTLLFQRDGKPHAVKQCKVYDTNSFSKTPGCAVLSYENNDAITFVVRPKANITYLNGEIPKEINLYICTSRFSNVLRGWRRPYDQLKWDRQCRKKGTVPFPAAGESATFTYNIQKVDPTALWFARAMVRCTTAQNTTDYCHYQNSTYAASPELYMIDGYTGVNTALTATMIAASCVGPLILIAFFTKEIFFQKKNV